MGKFDTGFKGRVHRGRRKQIALLVVGVIISVLCMLLIIGVTGGLDVVVTFFTRPSLEANSGKVYTPMGAVERALEKAGESRE